MHCCCAGHSAGPNVHSVIIISSKSSIIMAGHVPEYWNIVPKIRPQLHYKKSRLQRRKTRSSSRSQVNTIKGNKTDNSLRLIGQIFSLVRPEIILRRNRLIIKLIGHLPLLGGHYQRTGSSKNKISNYNIPIRYSRHSRANKEQKSLNRKSLISLKKFPGNMTKEEQQDQENKSTHWEYYEQ